MKSDKKSLYDEQEYISPTKLMDFNPSNDEDEMLLSDVENKKRFNQRLTANFN